MTWRHHPVQQRQNLWRNNFPPLPPCYYQLEDIKEKLDRIAHLMEENTRFREMENVSRKRENIHQNDCKRQEVPQNDPNNRNLDLSPKWREGSRQKDYRGISRGRRDINRKEGSRGHQDDWGDFRKGYQEKKKERKLQRLESKPSRYSH